MSHNTLENYYSTLFALSRHHEYRTNEIEDWIVFERDFMVDKVVQMLKEQEEARRLAALGKN
jgi:hypothetical protein